MIRDIESIYKNANDSQIRELVANHFKPTMEEKNRHAEYPTPIALVDEMLNVIPAEFWTTTKRVFEPCCGKGNFVLAIFDKFYEGLKEVIPDNIKRCELIMTECLYYADITPLNVLTTTNIL
jgi:type I restriction-modification system DNA methylase subunit